MILGGGEQEEGVGAKVGLQVSYHNKHTETLANCEIFIWTLEDFFSLG